MKQRVPVLIPIILTGFIVLLLFFYLQRSIEYYGCRADAAVTVSLLHAHEQYMEGNRDSARTFLKQIPVNLRRGPFVQGHIDMMKAKLDPDLTFEAQQ